MSLDERLEQINQKYEAQRKQIERSYWALQRRTILYGFVAVLLAVFCAVWVVKATGMNAWQAGVCGGALGITFQRIGWAIAKARSR